MIELEIDYVLRDGKPLGTMGAPFFVKPVCLSTVIISKEEVVKMTWEPDRSGWLPVEVFESLYEKL